LDAKCWYRTGLGDMVHRRIVEAPLGEHPERDVEELTTSASGG
jgi:hypothetical protein